MDKILAKLETYLLYAVVFLVPLAVLGISPNVFTPAKLTILSYGVALVLLVKAIRVIISGKLEFSVSSFDFPIFLIAGAYVVSTILRTPNKMEALLLPGTATAVVSGALLYFLLNQLSDAEKKMAGKILFYSGVVFAVIVLLAFAGVFANIPQLPVYMRANNFNPAAGYLPASIFLLSVLPLGAMFLMSDPPAGRAGKVTARRAFMGVASAVVILALAVAVFNMLPGKPLSPRFPSASVSWGVAIDSLKESPIFGVGPGNYLTAFSRFRPLSYNATDLWPIKFATANDFYLTALTETGLLGAAGLILLGLSFYRMVRGKFRRRSTEPELASGSKLITDNAPLLSTGILVILLAIFPATVLLVAVFFILLAFTSSSRKTSLTLASASPATGAEGAGNTSSKLSSRLPAFLVTLPVIVIVLFFFFRASRVIAAEVTFKRSIDALSQNQAQETYDLMRQAINTNPLVDRYHASYAQINLALANSIAQNAAGDPEAITDQDRANIAQLIQQSIREGKSTVALNPLRAANWELLARIYQAIIPFAQGSDVFAAQTMGQAVALDPINPNLRIALGGIHYGAGNFDTAIRVYELAVAAKPDHANAHYNLAFAYRDSGKVDAAIQQMTVVLSLVERGTDDYENARAALEDLESRREAATETPVGTELTPPVASEEPILKPPLELPEDSEPPEPPISPTPTPTEAPEEGETTPTVTPEVTPTP
ncbi:MAG: tetratricopeptide repeat protein [Patescibacteria group bacterium]